MLQVASPLIVANSLFIHVDLIVRPTYSLIKENIFCLRLTQDPVGVKKCRVITENAVGRSHLAWKTEIPMPNQHGRWPAGICRASPAVGQPSWLMTLQLDLNLLSLKS